MTAVAQLIQPSGALRMPPLHCSIVSSVGVQLCRRLRKMQPQQPGYGTSRTYLELLAELPWQIASEEHEIDLVAAKERLDSEHYGLSKVKKRIIEYLAVRKVSSLHQAPSTRCSNGELFLSFNVLQFLLNSKIVKITCVKVMPDSVIAEI